MYNWPSDDPLPSTKTTRDVTAHRARIHVCIGKVHKHIHTHTDTDIFLAQGSRLNQ